MIHRHPNDTISRRRFMRGLGIAMSLPWLESLAALPGERTEDWQRAAKIAEVGSHQHPDRDT